MASRVAARPECPDNGPATAGRLNETRKPRIARLVPFCASHGRRRLDEFSYASEHPLSLVKITDRFDAGTPDGDLVAFSLNKPAPGTESTVYAIPLEGWALTRRSPARLLEIHRDGIFIDQFPVGSPRPDIAQAHPDIPWAGETGFNVELGALNLPTDFSLQVTAVLEDHTRVFLATLVGHRELPAGDASGIQPLMITTLGRSGSSWVLKMLSERPEIVAYAPTKYEVRFSSYWTDVFLALSQPPSYRQSVAARIESDDWWLGRPRRPDDGLDRDMLEFLGRDQVDALKSFCRGRIEAFYDRITPPSDTGVPRYFAEKRQVSYKRQIYALREMFPGAREIFLVRDFRDMVASILDFNRRQGVVRGFPRGEADSDVEYVGTHLAAAVVEFANAWRERSDWAHLVKYEDLVLRPHETLRSVLRYLDLDATEDELERMLAAGTENSEWQAIHRTTATATDSVGRWRTDLSPELIETCESEFGEALETFGYTTRRALPASSGLGLSS
jgi:Sulfotransferase family